jgi:hypothetical protein
VPDAFEVLLEVLLHLDGDTVSKQILSLSHELGREVAQTLGRELAIGSTAEVHLGVHELVPALFALPRRLILEELHLVSTFRAPGFEDGARFPISAVLSRAFHDLRSCLVSQQESCVSISIRPIDSMAVED